MNVNPMFKVASITLISSVLAAVSFSANAMGTEWQDNTTCYVLKQDKLVLKSKCSYKASLASSTTFGYQGYQFNIPNRNMKLDAEINSTARRDRNDNPILNRSGSAVFDTKITLNGKPAVNHYRYGSSLKPVPRKMTENYDTGAPKGVLNCMKEKASPSWEICAPASDVSLGGF